MIWLRGPPGLFTELNYPGKGAYTQTDISLWMTNTLASLPVALRRLNTYVTTDRASEDRGMVVIPSST